MSKRVQWGPAPFDPRSPEADPVNIARYLHAEKNVIACQVLFYVAGDGTSPIGKAGLSVEMSVKHGPVTLLSVVDQPGGKLMLLVAEGNSVRAPILQIGNTNSRYQFPSGGRNFVNSLNSYGPAHHCAVGSGKISSKIKKLGVLLNLDVVQVC